MTRRRVLKKLTLGDDMQGGGRDTQWLDGKQDVGQDCVHVQTFPVSEQLRQLVLSLEGLPGRLHSGRRSEGEVHLL